MTDAVQCIVCFTENDVTTAVAHLKTLGFSENNIEKVGKTKMSLLGAIEGGQLKNDFTYIKKFLVIGRK